MGHMEKEKAYLRAIKEEMLITRGIDMPYLLRISLASRLYSWQLDLKMMYWSQGNFGSRAKKTLQRCRIFDQHKCATFEKRTGL